MTYTNDQIDELKDFIETKSQLKVASIYVGKTLIIKFLHNEKIIALKIGNSFADFRQNPEIDWTKDQIEKGIEQLLEKIK